MCVDPRQAGVTLMELIFALILGGMALLGLGFVFGIDSGLWVRGQAKMALHAGATRALEEIGRDAGHASDIVSGEDGLFLRYPVSPLTGTARPETEYKLREQCLWRNDTLVVPQLGDTTLGVADFRSAYETDDETGMRLLKVRLSLFARRRPEDRVDTPWFETDVHARNRGLGGASPASSPAPTGGIFF